MHPWIFTMKKSYTSTFKAQVILALLKEDKTLTQVAADYQVPPSALRDWRTIVMTNLAHLFEQRDSTAALQAAHNRQLDELYAEIGRLTTQVNWMKKKFPS